MCLSVRVFIAYLVILLRLFFVQPAEASEEVIFEHLSLEEGLSQTTVNCILKDKKGYMWFGTNGGLNRYDGYTFKVYDKDPFEDNSLSSNMITSLYENDDGIIWIGTLGGGINKFDPSTESFISYRHLDGETESLGSDLVRTLYGDSKGNLWIGLFREGIDRFNSANGTFIHYSLQDEEGTSEIDVLSIYEDSWGRLWLGTSIGLYFYDPDRDVIRPYVLTDRKDVSVDDAALCVIEDHRNRLWIGFASGTLVMLDRGSPDSRYSSIEKKFQRIGDCAIVDIYEDVFGELWLATDGGGLLRFNPETDKFSIYQMDPTDPRSLNDNKIISIFGDDGDSIFYGDLTGIIWLGTHSRGIEKFHLKRPFQRYGSKSYNIRGVAGDNVYSVFKDSKENLWIGTYGNGLKSINAETDIIRHYRYDPEDPSSLSSNRVYTVFEDSLGSLWIGTDRGLNLLDSDGEGFSVYFNHKDTPGLCRNNEITTIAESGDGTLWLGTRKGVFSFDRKTALFQTILSDVDGYTDLCHDLISQIMEDSSGCLWITTLNDGFFCFDPKARDLKHYVDGRKECNTTISSNCVHSVYEDGRGCFWLGTDAGLNRFDAADECFTFFTERDGLPDNTIKGILEDDYHRLWLSTNYGLSRFDTKTGDIRNYNLGDGLQGEEFHAGAVFKDHYGKMYFGGIRGCNSFYPSNISENPHVPPIVINEFSVFNKPVNLGKRISDIKTITLSHKQDFFSFDFSALDYTDPRSNQYRFMLEGFDQEWVMAGNRHYASYTNLDSGRYVFKVQGSNNNGIWNRDGATIEVVVQPSPWQTLPAYGVYFSLIILIFVLVNKYISNKQEKETEARLRRATEKINERLKENYEKLKYARKHEALYRDRLRSLASALSTAEEKERRRIAAEVHDSIGQNLALMKIRLVMTLESIKEEDLCHELEGLVEVLTDSIKCTRTLTFELGSPVLYSLGFAASVECLAEKMKEEHGLTISYEEQGLPNVMNDDIKAFLFRALRELVMNVVKHAGTDRVLVRTSHAEEKMIRLSVVDKGAGFDPEELNRIDSGTQSFGLFSLQERLKSLGGHMSVKSALGRGTKVTLFVPVNSFRS